MLDYMNSLDGIWGGNEKARGTTMLSQADNDLITSVGPGTPGGEFHRRYWQPISSYAELLKKSVKKIRILGEDLVLFRNLSGKLGLVENRCAHRNTALEHGIS